MGPSEESDIVNRLGKQLSDDNIINTNDDDDDVELQTRSQQQQQQHQQHQQQQQQQAQQQQPLPHHDHIQLLMNALEKLDPDKNGLVLVPKEITSSTLTTRLKGVCKINRLIDYSNDLCHSFTEIGAQAKYQEAIGRFRDWILENKIIEHIFGPNCHVEIIKQSHTILNFVAYTLNDEHVNVIWSASLLKHCGRQVLDLLTSLIRFMRTGPVLHLYWLVKNLNIEDHSEHTLLLTSHILRFIWSHSPCINQIQFCNRQPQQQSPPITDLDIRLHPRQHNQHYNNHSHNQQRLSNSPLSEYSATKCDGDGREPIGDVKQSVVDHILKSISTSSATSSSSDFSSHEQRHQHLRSTDIVPEPLLTIANDKRQPVQCDLETDTDGREWLTRLKSDADFLDNTSDVSACCSEEKNMEDFDDEAQEFIQDENTIGDTDEPNPSPNRMFKSVNQHHAHNHGPHNKENPKSRTLNGSSSRSLSSDLENRGEILGFNDSTSTSRDSESKFRLSLEQNRDPQHNDFQQPLESVAQFKELKKASGNLSDVTAQLSGDEDLKRLSEYNLGNLSEPGKTVLWDLLQDGKIELLASNLHVEIENVLVNLVMSFGDRYIRYKFIEACLENLSVGTSVIISLRLLPKLMSFNTISRNLSIPAINETHTIVLWAESEYNMSQNFFKNLVDYYHQRQQLFSKLMPLPTADGTTATCTAASAMINEQIRHLEEYGDLNCKSPLFSHIDKIITRMSFLTFIYSKPFSPETMKLSREQMDQLWDCLASDSNLRCSDVLFQWIYQQAVGDDFHGVNDELLDYVLKHKLPTLRPEHFRLRGLKLLEQLLWIRQDYECCHGLEHPATRLLWDIALKAVDDEVSMAAIRILNHFYIYTNHRKSTKCDKGINFMNYCMDQLHSSLKNLTNLDESKRDQRDDLKDVNQLLDLMQKVILLIRTHLEVFRAHWSFYLRISQLNNEADLISHRLNAYEIKLTMTVRLVCQAASSMDKTTIEVQAGDFVGELRAEIVKWWFSHVDRTYFERPGSLSPSRSLTNSTSSSPSSNITSTNQHLEDTLTNASTNDKEMKHMSGRGSRKSPLGGINSFNGFTEFLLANHHSLRLLSHNQEIPFEWDERQINELDFKDLQVIYVLNDIKSNPNVDVNDDIDSDKSTESPQQNYPPKTEIPSILLLRYEYFERLMEADRFLGSFQSANIDLTNRAKTLSRRVWEIIQILPTCPHYEEDLKRCGSPDDEWRLKNTQCSSLLSAECPQKLLYSLQIIDILKSSIDNPTWGYVFIRKGGLEDIFDVFMSQKLLPDENEDWNEWLQECLAYLLKLLFQFGTRPVNSPLSSSSSIVVDSPASSSSSKMSVQSSGSSRTIMTDNSSNSVKRARRNRNRLLGSNTSPVSAAVVMSGSVAEDRLPIPQFSDELLKLLANTDLIFDKLIRILTSSAFSSCHSDQYYYVTMSSRAMIVHHVMSFLSSWCKSDPKFPRFQIANYGQLLKALILDDTDPSTRREACNGFFKLHHACSVKPTPSTANNSIGSINSTLNASLDTTNTSGILASNNSSTTSIQCDTSWTSSDIQQTVNATWTFSADLLKCLIEFLPIAETMKPPKPIRNYVSENDYIKELNSPGCKDYFWLTCRLIDSQATQIDGYGATKIKSTAMAIGNKEQKEELISMDESLKAADGDKMIAGEDGRPNTSIRSDISSVSNCATSSNAINLFELCEYLVVAIRKRRTYETRDFSVEDDTLRGMLLMMVMALRRDPSFRYTITAFEFIHELYEYLFAPPNQSQRYLPKCKSPTTRSTAFDLMISLVERCPKNYFGLLELLLVDQHNSVVKGTYPTDYWPHDDCRSEVGFVGLINLGATCYLATCMQHLFMIPNLRYAILSIEDTKTIRHGEIIRELQKIFAFMLESERKAYNPRNFCKVYTMDNHPLNIAEQTDMTEFLTDLITKLEESSPELRQIIKGLFSGTLSNNVVSLDCPHISRTTEEFYTLRVQVADMRNLNDSLDELTVKDTLEGDNMYTCSTCEKKVRAEKRACIVKLPRILCFNTMRYTFNMATMTKEKVNTHFSFPLKLDMADYLEVNLMKRQQSSLSNAGSYSSKDSALRSSSSSSASTTSSSPPNSSPPSVDGCCHKSRGPTKELSGQDDCEHSTKNSADQHGEHMQNRAQSPQPGMARSPSSCSSEPASAASTSPAQEVEVNDGQPEGESDTMYELIGVTVHTGNADGGHYYCFIRDCEDHSKDKPRWYLFNDAEVKLFDDSLIGTECYGGELTTKSYDAINDRFMDFSIEKTNSAYMLFYKRVDYKYKSRSVALRYLESDTQRTTAMPPPQVRRQSESDGHESTVNEGEMELSGEPKSESRSAARAECPLTSQATSCANDSGELDFNLLCQETYEEFKLPKNLANWIWSDNMKFARDKNVFEHNYFSFMWQICANLPRTLNHIPEHLVEQHQVMSQTSAINQASDDAIAIRTVHLAIAFVLGVLMNSRERPNLSNWTELIRKQFNSSKAACDWLMHLIDDEETWLKQMLLKCPIEMVRQLFQRLCNDLTGSRQHKKLRLVR